MLYASYLLTNLIQYIQCLYLVASSILCHTPICTNMLSVALNPSGTHLTSFYAHTCITTVQSLHLQLANKPCPNQRFRTRRAGPPSIVHIWECIHKLIKKEKMDRLVIRLCKCQVLLISWRPQIHSYLVTH